MHVPRPCRQRVLKSGTISFAGGAIDCVMRNVSEGGAALDVESPVGIPDRFDLVMKAETLVRKCWVVWRKDKRIGVSFEPMGQSTPEDKRSAS